MANATVDTVVAEITQANTVIDGAIVYVASIPKLIADAVTAAIANGATAAELQPVSDLGASLKAKSDALVQAIAANTPSPAPTPQQLKAAKS